MKIIYGNAGELKKAESFSSTVKLHVLKKRSYWERQNKKNK